MRTLQDFQRFFEKKPELEGLCKQIRACNNKGTQQSMKKALPTINVGYHKDSLTGWMSFDIDNIYDNSASDEDSLANQSVTESLKELMELPYVAMIGKSIRNGAYILCKVDYFYHTNKDAKNWHTISKEDSFNLFLKIYYQLWLELQLKLQMQIDFLPDMDRVRFYSDNDIIAVKNEEDIVPHKMPFKGNLSVKYVTDNEDGKPVLVSVDTNTLDGLSQSEYDDLTATNELPFPPL